jgi:hypothetical protein
MAVLCRDLGLLYVLNPATGSTAIGSLLRERYGGEWLPAENRPNVRKKHSTLRELLDAGLLGLEEREKLCVATNVRNPYDRLVSIYWKRMRIGAEQLADPGFWIHRHAKPDRIAEVEWIKRHDFSSWIRRRFVRNWLPRLVRGQSPSVYARFVDGVDIVLRHERLQQDFDDLIRRRGGTPVEIPLRNVTMERASRDYRDEYDALSRTLVRIGQRADLERFGYSF